MVPIIIGCISCVILLVISYLVAIEFYVIAQSKGHNSKKYFWFPFLLGIIGYLMVVALPDRIDSFNTNGTTNNNLPEL